MTLDPLAKVGRIDSPIFDPYSSGFENGGITAYDLVNGQTVRQDQIGLPSGVIYGNPPAPVVETLNENAAIVTTNAMNTVGATGAKSISAASSLQNSATKFIEYLKANPLIPVGIGAVIIIVLMMRGKKK